jgi:hypothetical protein
MKELLKSLLYAPLLIALSASGVYAEEDEEEPPTDIGGVRERTDDITKDSSEGSPLYNMMQALDWNHFAKKLRITGEIIKCEYKDDITFGFKAALTAPVAIAETSPEWGYSLTLETSLLGSKPTADGVAITKDTGHVWTHLYGFNPLGAIFKKINAGGFLSLPTGPIFTPIYISELPGMFCEDDIKSGALNSDITSMINPVTVLAGIADCVNSEAMDFFDNTLMSGWKAFAFVGATFHYNNGCSGPIPINCKTLGSDQIADSIAQTTRMMNWAHKTFIFEKTADFGIGKEPWCQSSEYPSFPKSQYHFQLAFPTVGEANVFGVSPSTYAIYANKMSAEGGTAAYVWQIRHYSAFGTKQK